MIRLTLFYIIVCTGLIYVWRDWFVVLCGLVVLTVLLQHGDMPTQLLGIAGLNPWNLLFACITLAWFMERMHTPREDRIPLKYLLLWFAYAAVLGLACIRAAFGGDSFKGYEHFNDPMTLIADWLINPLKFMWLLVLFYEGAWTRKRAQLALGTVLAVGVIYGLLVLRYLPIQSLIGEGDFMRVRRLIERQIGLHANDMAKILVATTWGLIASYKYWKSRKLRWAVIGGLGIASLGAILCYSRAGYVAMVAVGVGLGLLAMRKLLVLIPVAIVAVVLLFPSVADRASMGFGEQTVCGASTDNWDTISAGRTTNLWPPVVDAILDSPVLGYGRLAILRTDVYERVEELEGSTPSHPHNAYLEVLLDSGLVGLAVVLAAFFGVLYIAIRLLLTKDDLLASAVGAVTFAHLATLLAVALGGTAFFFTQSSVAPICCAGLALRVWHERRQSIAQQRPIGVVHRPAVAPVSPVR